MSSLKHLVGKVMQVIVPETEPLTDEQMARMMRPLVRVVPGTHWPKSGHDSQWHGNGSGTVVAKSPTFPNTWLVTWDISGETHSHLMGSRGVTLIPEYHLKIQQAEVIH